MDRKTIITKTGKGMREALGTIRTLPRDLHELLSRIDGRSSIEDLATQHAGSTAVEVETHLARLAAEGYIRELPVSAGDPQPGGDGADLDFTSRAWFTAAMQAEQGRRDEEQARLKAEATARRWAEKRAVRRIAAKAKREAEELAKREAAKRARHEAEDKVRREAEERARLEAERARREAEERARREAAERARREAEDRARREAEERARLEAERAQREAEERAKREAEERARREAAERARREAEERATREAEERTRLEAERAQREAEERAKREAEERARREAAEQARREAEDRARREAEERARLEAERARREAEEGAKRKAEERAQREAAKRAKREAKNQARREAKELARRKAAERARRKAEDNARARVYLRRPVKPGRLAARALACLVLCLILLHALPFDWRIPSLERVAAAQLGQPVKIRSVHLSLVPQPHWRLAGVFIGDQRQIQIPAVRMIAGVGSLFSDQPAFTAVELDAPRIDAENMARLLFGKPDARGLVSIHVDARNVVLDSGGPSLPNFDLSTDIGTDGQWRTIVANSTDRAIAIELHAEGNKVRVVASGGALALPFSAAPQLADWRVTGSATRSGLDLTTFEGRLLGGRLDGSARLTWQDMRIDGTLHATRIDAAQLYPGLFAAGVLDVTAAFALPLQRPDKEATAPRLAGQFSIQRGTLGSVNLGNVMKNLGAGGITRFAKLDGSFVHAGSRTQLRDLHLDAGAMSARGYADVDADQKIQGIATITLSLPGERHRTSVDLAGTFRPPYGRNVRWQRQ